MYHRINETMDLLRGLGNAPRFHGNGFTQLYLRKDVRLHVWHASLAPLRNHNATIHNHRYDIESTVYRGTLVHKTYSVNPSAPQAEHDVRVVQLDGASDAHKTPEIETGLTGRLELRHQYTFTRGSSYTFKRPYFHSISHVGREPVVTIFEKRNYCTEWARVLTGIDDEQATHAFAPETQPDVATLWSAVREGLYGASRTCHARVRYEIRQGAGELL